MQSRRDFLETVSFDEGPMPELDGAVSWINTTPLRTAALRGKVVLIDVWTYSCINSIRQLPYLKAWAAKYKDAGLVVLGVHAPEFGFEKQRANVEKAVRDLGITYPVAVDTNHGIWRALRNNYWPADYFVDAKGRIRRHHFGEGDYDASERFIQSLLRESGATGVDGAANVVARGIEAAPDNANTGSAETYIGYNRAENFASPERVAPDAAQTYTFPVKLPMNYWALSGSWHVSGENAVLRAARGRIAFRFHSRDLHVVLGPSTNGAPVPFVVKLDGVNPNVDCGTDTAADGSGEVREPRLYQLVRQNGAVRDRTFEIEFLDRGVEAFAFTFG